MENERRIDHIIPEGQIEVWPELGFENPYLRPAPPIDPNNAECLDTRLFEVRSELQAIQPNEGGVQLPEIIEGLPPVDTSSPLGVLQEKSVLRKQKELREKQPKGYSEKLLFLSDLQLVSLTHDESLGAILKYLDDEKGSFTHVVLGGDIFDFWQQASFSKDNALGDAMTRDEIAAGQWFMDWMNERFGHTKRVFTKGNHEDRYKNFYENTTNGVKEWLIPFEEMFHLQGWEMYEYGRGQSYDWHGIKMWHGEKGGPKQNTPKIEIERSFRSVTFGHSPTNRSWEAIDADGNILRGNQHAGVSDHPEYNKNGYKQVSDGFGVYYYTRVKGRDVIADYSIKIPINSPRFISPEGKLYDGTGFDLRETIGLETPKRGRGRPRKGS